LTLANKYGLKDEMSQSYEELSTIYEKLEEPKNSLFHFKEHIKYKDSVNNLTNVQKLADLRTDFELSKKQIELDLINQLKENQGLITKSIGVVLILVSVLTYALYRRNRFISQTRKVLEKERQKSKDLLCNILPEETADELREKGSVKAKKYQSVTVLFSDFEGFTKYAEELPPEELIKTIDLYFSEFDQIMDKYNIEKIKTIGDSYMCASGLPIPNKDHAEQMILAAQEMLAHVERMKEVHAIDEARFNVRIGIHTGPIVAGVVGKRKFAYDIWGDTVNIASRMESACAPGKINLSIKTYELVKEKFNFESRGEIEIKNSAPIAMYYLNTKH
jgi:adenylate cyclase